MSNGKNTVVLAGGGTGGHLYPALAVADELRDRHDADIVFFGAERGIEQRLVPRAGYPLVSLRLSGLKGSGPVASARAAMAAGGAVVRSLAWMLRRRPGVVIGVGGYASGPAVLAGKVAGRPTMVMEQNHYPGATNRWLAPWVGAVCLPSESARRFVRGRIHVTGTPVRRPFFDVPDVRPGDRLRLLVFGGSRGARSINDAMAGALDRLGAAATPIEVVHQTGTDDLDRIRTAYDGYPHPYEVHAFLDDMPNRLSRADLVVCRAGASTLAELAAAGRPAVLVPYPHAADDHQRRNAESVAEHGAAEWLADRDLDGPELARRVLALAADTDRRVAMGRSARELARPDATRDIVGVALRLMGGGKA